MFDSLINWSNQNSGFLTLILFVVTILFGWASGIFRQLMHKPRFTLEIIPGPSLCTVITTGEKHGEFDVHRTAFSLYLRVTNIGSAPASIDNVKAAFHWHLKPISWLWIRYRIFWYWLPHPIIAMDNFQYDFGEKIKTYPSLFQGNILTGERSHTYLQVGQSTNGVVYFEATDSWGGCFPALMRDGQTKIRVAIVDSFKNKYKKTFYVPTVSWEEAKKYNPSFGGTFATIRGDEELGDYYETLNKQLNTDSGDDSPPPVS